MKNKNHSKRTILILLVLTMAIFFGIKSLFLNIARSQTAPAVFFEPASSSGSEGTTSVNIPVKLSSSSSQTVKVDYQTTAGTASPIAEGTGQDYIPLKGTLTFNPGETEKNITLSIINDTINETDETIQITFSNPQNAIPGANSSYIYTITDDDRGILASVKDYGATPNDDTDDTAAIQKAVDDVFAKGGGSTGKGGVLVFPEGVYIVRKIFIRDNITYQGYGAIIKRMDNMISWYTTHGCNGQPTCDDPVNAAKWTRTFSNWGWSDSGTAYNYSGDTDSKPLVIKGLTFDGNSQTQGVYKNYEQEQAMQLILIGDNSKAGRLKVYIEDCYFKNSIGDGGMNLRENVDATVYSVTGKDLFDGGIFITRGENNFNSRFRLKNITTLGDNDPPGIFMEPSNPNTDSKPSEIYLSDSKFVGDFVVGVEPGTLFRANNIEGASTELYTYGADVKFENSKFNIGTSYLGFSDPGNALVFDKCEFNFTEQGLVEQDRNIWFNGWFSRWQDGWVPVNDAKVTFNNCRFGADSTIDSTDTVTGFNVQHEPGVADGSNNSVEFNGCHFSSNLDVGIQGASSTILTVKNTLNEAITPIVNDASVSYSDTPGPLPSDTNPPGGIVAINNGDIISASNSVTLSLSAFDANPVARMRISNVPDFNTAQEFDYAISKSWTLNPGKGIQPVYVWFRDSLGNWTPAGSPHIDTIYSTFEGSPPAITTDLNSDNLVNQSDFDILKNDFLKLTANLANPKSDIDGDGKATIKDIGILMSGWKP